MHVYIHAHRRSCHAWELSCKRTIMHRYVHAQVPTFKAIRIRIRIRRNPCFSSIRICIEGLDTDLVPMKHLRREDAFFKPVFRFRPDPKLFGLTAPDPDPSLLHIKLINMF